MVESLLRVRTRICAGSSYARVNRKKFALVSCSPGSHSRQRVVQCWGQRISKGSASSTTNSRAPERVSTSRGNWSRERPSQHLLRTDVVMNRACVPSVLSVGAVQARHRGRDPSASGRRRTRRCTTSATSLVLGRRDVHIWWAPFGIDDQGLDLLERSLDAQELRTADRFRFVADRRRYVHAHGVSRAVLARYLGAAPHELAFRRGLHGKPALTIGRLHFSLSYSSGLVLCAISRAAAVGVDAEREGSDARDHVSRWLLPPPVAQALDALPEERRDRAFLRAWTRWEALVKARGDGLSADMRSLESLMVPELPATLGVRTGVVRRRWCLRDLALEPGYVGALATQHPIARLSCRAWLPADQRIEHQLRPAARTRRPTPPALAPLQGELR